MTKIIQKQTGKIVLGCEHFLAHHLDIVKNKKVGLITNPTGTDSQLNSLIDLFHKNPDIDLVALYGPEHGVYGDAQSGEYVPFHTDEKYGLPVFSLYGQSMRSVSEGPQDMDASMRSFDTVADGKFLEDSMIESVDVLVFDIQDIGTRIYTYVTTMAYCMQVCANKGIEFVVLDRPNPINGVNMEGPVLEYPEFSSFVGLYPIPVRHGMTTGELAHFFNDRFLPEKVNLNVIPMKGWTRSMWYDHTGLPWIFPSPNIPTLQTAIVYPGQVFLEGTNISEGRGTTKPFEQFGAPWINGHELIQRLNNLALLGVKFRETWFLPNSSKFRGELCNGIQMHVFDRESFQPFQATLHIIKTVREMCPRQFQFHAHYFDKIIGSSVIRQAIEKETEICEIVSTYSPKVEEFAKLRGEYLLY
ncbi:MAG: DUF1343 domain-containing protein [Candidatus Aminicenantes bacterium]|nr:MAG: DUF1343 domain-containing protein [Candidatus Aminicenantes bacterium]